MCFQTCYDSANAIPILCGLIHSKMFTSAILTLPMALATKVQHPKVEVLYNTGKIVALNYYGAMRAAEIPQLVARSCHGCWKASHAVQQ